jgi:hypothetical protein
MIHKSRQLLRQRFASTFKATAFVLFFTTPLLSFALTFKGSFTQTITETQDPEYQVGLTYHGEYTYESPTIDGTFYTSHVGWNPYWPDIPSEYSLKGLLYQTFSGSAISSSGQYMGWGLGGRYATLDSTNLWGTSLTVLDGQVTSFGWAFEHGGFLMQMNDQTFRTLSFYDRVNFAEWTEGTVVFGAPNQVPDTTSTVFLFVTGVLVLCIGRFLRAGLGSQSR